VAVRGVANLNRPGGNVTGVSFFSSVVGTKRLELLRQLVPRATTIAVLVNPDNPNTEADRRDVQAAALAIGQDLVVLDARSVRDIETAFATFVHRGAGALLAGGGAFLNSNRERIVALAARHALPTSYAQRETVVAGGLMSYGASITDAYRQVGIYAGRIFKGEKPADLPVQYPTKYDLVINLKNEAARVHRVTRANLMTRQASTLSAALREVSVQATSRFLLGASFDEQDSLVRGHPPWSIRGV
jgi:putative ABC transport system substrate-binding protein